MKCVLLTNIPAPYREKVFELVSKSLNRDFHVLFCSDREPGREWQFPHGDFSRTFLESRFVTIGDRAVHVNFDVLKRLSELDPDILITSGYQPTFLMAFAWARVRRRPHICFTDGWLEYERSLTFVHRGLRRFVLGRSQAFIGASRRSLDLFRHYGVPEQALFQSPLAIDSRRYRDFAGADKKYDILFSGQFIDRKMPLFFAEVAGRIREIRGACSALVLGSGPLKDAFLHELKRNRVDFHYGGYASQEALPDYYGSCRLLLFPTKADAWGVVANEALSAGVPVITTPQAGAAGELVLHGVNGFVLPPIKELWAERAAALLEDRKSYAAFGADALQSVEAFTCERAAKGILDAIAYCR